MAWKARIGKMDIKILDRDHPPPHVHVFGMGLHAKISIKSGEVISGQLGPRLRRKVLKYVADNRHTLLQAWRGIEAEQRRGTTASSQNRGGEGQ